MTHSDSAIDSAAPEGRSMREGEWHLLWGDWARVSQPGEPLRYEPVVRRGDGRWYLEEPEPRSWLDRSGEWSGEVATGYLVHRYERVGLVRHEIEFLGVYANLDAARLDSQRTDRIDAGIRNTACSVSDAEFRNILVSVEAGE